MDFYYSTDRNSQLLVSLLKAHGIKRVIASPGMTNVSLVVSLQHDPFFEMYSCVDERSAAYMACGLAAKTGEPVVIVCTEATASRNYLPGLTEAYHRKLPILAITGMHGYTAIGHVEPQVIDRSVSPADSLRLKVHLPVIRDKSDIKESELKINQALLELTRHGGGPVHINFPVPRHYDFSEKELPPCRVIRRYYICDELPALPNGKVAVFIGTHRKWTPEATQTLDTFCEKFNAVVFGGIADNYQGKYGVNTFLLASQPSAVNIFEGIKLVLHIGEETADLFTQRRLKAARETWRISEDGELRDAFQNLTKVFEMREQDFFQAFIDRCPNRNVKNTFLPACRAAVQKAAALVPELPFSNIYVASRLAPQLPENAALYLGASNTSRAWSMFDLPKGVDVDSNMGCRGIDGTLSSAIGYSLADRGKLCFCVLGDLSFFYDMNALGNRHIGANLRILLINNGGGSLLKRSNAPGYRIGEENCDLYVSAGGHFGNRSRELVKGYAESLGFTYMSAANKTELEKVSHSFLSPSIAEKPLLLEVFTEDADERESFNRMGTLMQDANDCLKQQAKKLLGRKGSRLVSDFLRNSK